MIYGASNLPTPGLHMAVLYRQGPFNTLAEITEEGLTQDNRVGNPQKANNTRLDARTNKGILAGSVVAIAGEGLVGPCKGDSTTAPDKAVGIAVNDAVGNPFESTSAVASGRAVYVSGTATVFKTDIYETVAPDGTTAIVYTAGDYLYASQNGLLTNEQGLANGNHFDNTNVTLVGILLQAPSMTDPWMVVQLRI